MTMAQSLTTHSVYDVNQNGDINVADAVSVAQAAVQGVEPGQTQQYVTGEDLSTMFSTILSKLESLETRMTALENIVYEVDGYSNGHKFVDLGIVVNGKSVYWATTNIGAELPADYGQYFAWGETVGYGSSPQGAVQDVTVEILDDRKFDWVSYSSDLCDGSETTMKKYCNDSSYGPIDDKTVLDPEDDAAHVKWQGAWRMPTEEEQDALLTQCTWTWTTMKNSAGKSVNGYKVSNNTDSGKYIFLPAAGYRSDGNLCNARSYGFYWSSSLYANGSGLASCFGFYLDNQYANCNYRCVGLPIRPVCQ